jgi:predicted nucleic acid-binding protein
MTFSQLAVGSSVFVDATSFVHFFQPHPRYGSSCRQLLERIELQQLAGFTATHVLGEVGHRLMTLEARSAHGWSTGKVLQRLKQHYAVIQALSRWQTAIDDVLNSRVQVLAIAPAQLAQATRLGRQHGLLFNDALTVVVMQGYGLASIASQDADFDRVPGITRYAPV